MVLDLLQKENNDRQGGNQLKVSPVTSDYAQEWADELARRNTEVTDPQHARGCGGDSYQVVATGRNANQISAKILRQTNKWNRTIGNHKMKFVGTGISKINEQQYLVVQNFCTWKPK